MRLLTEAIIMDNHRKQKAAEIQNTKSSTSNVIPELNNDCLLHIFSFLPIMDRIRIQRVCKRWREISKLPWQDMKRFDNYSTTWTIDLDNFHYLPLSKKILQQIFQLCGGYLKEIDISFQLYKEFGEITEELEKELQVLLKKSCSNIEILNLRDVNPCSKTFQYFAKYFNCITDFSLGSNWAEEFSDENSLARFFRKNGNLRSVRLCSIILKGRCLKYLPLQSIEELTFDDCYIKNSELDSVSKQISNLKIFRFTSNWCDNFDDFFDWISSQSNLKEMEIVMFYMKRPFILKSKTILHHLETLKLSGNEWLSDDLLMSVSENYKNLIKVELYSSSDNVTDASLIHVLSLPNLQHVSLLNLSRITDNALLTEMLQLKSLQCVLCPLLQNDGLRAVLESSRNLESLFINLCQKVSTTTLIKDAVQITKNRQSNVKLILRVPRNEICEDINDSPQLQIKGI